MAASLALGALLAIGDASAPSAAYAGEKSAKAKKTQTGLASYYSRRLEGKETASGETFRNDELVAAHRSYPFGTRARVTNLENGRSVVVRITDRGASAGNRREGVIIDVSQAAAARLKMKKDGRVRVRVQVLEWGEDDHPPMAGAGRKP
ncbi:MAG: septal ring lytic transglycosylase RlpA family protein [Burkholderiales bacterium]